MEDKFIDDENKNEINFLHSKPFNLKDLNITEEDLKLRMRSNSSLIPSIKGLEYCLDFVPKLK
jgi:hypothetical protein